MLRCYCCGKPITDRIALVAMSDNVDRVFIVHPKDCLKLVIDDASNLTLVKVEKTKCN